MFLLNSFLPEALGITSPIVNTYAKFNSTERLVFKFSELLTLFEVFNHLMGIQTMKRHIFIFTVWALFVCFMVLPLYTAVSLRSFYVPCLTVWCFRTTGLSTGLWSVRLASPSATCTVFTSTWASATKSIPLSGAASPR